MRRELVVEAGAGEAVANFFGRSAGSDAFGQAYRANRVANMRDRLQIALVKFQRGRLHLLFEIIGQLPVDLAFDRLARLAVRHTEKPFEHLFRRDWIAVTCQRLGMRAA